MFLIPFILSSFFLTATVPGQNERQHVGLKPVIVELFTSEGCSSCPPADELLRRLQQQQPVPGALIIPLGEHVDYWDRLGWKDPYSDRIFSDRQREFARITGSSRVYTPQMIVNGSAEFVGSNRGQAVRAVRLAASEASSVELELKSPSEPSSSRLNFSIHLRGLEKNSPYRLMLALTEDGLSTDVRRGENVGKILHHVAVVRQLETLTEFKASGPTLDFEAGIEIDPDWDRSKTNIVTFVENPKSRKILAAGLSSLTP